MPNKAMITVTTADSKYSRMTVLGGPVGSVSTNDSRSRPLGLTGRALKTPLLLFSVVIAGSFIEDIVDAGTRDGQARLFSLCSFSISCNAARAAAASAALIVGPSPRVEPPSHFNST